MAASFIQKSDYRYYLRLTANTTSVKFAAVSEAGNTYTFSVDGNVVVSKPYNDESTIYYSSSADPIPSGGVLDNGRFPGAETVYNFPGSGIRDYLLSVTAGPTEGTLFHLGGEPLSWGGYAYPGDGYVSNALALGVKRASVTTQSGALVHIFDDQTNTNTLFQNTGASFGYYNPNAPDAVPCNPNSFNYDQKFYRVRWSRPIPLPNYDLQITILSNQSASGAHAGFMNLCSIGAKNSDFFDVQFYASNVNGISYIRSFSATATLATSWSNAGNIFVKDSNSWKEVQSAWIKNNGSWTKVFQNYGNSSWINMLEGYDDPIDFGVKVIALN